MFEEQGIATELSGCLSLSLPRELYHDPALAARRRLLAIDLPEDAFGQLPAVVRREAVRLSQHLPTSDPQTQAHRTAAAGQRLTELASARLVVTTKLHAALRSLWDSRGVDRHLGGPEEPGYGHAVHPHVPAGRRPGLAARLAVYPWESPPPNPDPATKVRLTSTQHEMLTRAGLDPA